MFKCHKCGTEWDITLEQAEELSSSVKKEKSIEVVTQCPNKDTECFIVGAELDAWDWNNPHSSPIAKLYTRAIGEE